MRSPEAQQVVSVLQSTLMLVEPGGQHRTFDPIVRPSAGGEWSTAHGCYDGPTIAAMVLDPKLIVGIRHRHQTRLVVLDIDAHGAAVSPYWHPDGPEHSPALQRLLAEAEAVGCGHAIYRTPSGGWHCWLALPEAVHHSEAATIGQALAARAALQVAPGRLEVFPSLTRWSDCQDARHRPRSNGFRLPGQQGAASWIGGPVGWCSEPSTAWEEAAAAVELADGAATAGWAELLEEAAELRRRHRPRLAPRGPGAARHRPHRAHAVEWTGPGQSNKNIGLLATRLYQPGEASEVLGARVAAAARACPGFSRYASRDTVGRLDAWCRDWASYCHRYPPRAVACRLQSTDPGRNHRLHREAVAKVIDAAVAIAKEHGEAALRFSERRLAELLSMSRNTFRKVKALFRTRLAAAIARPAVVGPHPYAKGGATAQHHQSPDCSPEIESLDPVPSVAFRPCRPPPPPLLAMPIAPARDSTSRREFERNELARWLGLAAA
jgi:hypothetical protein